MSQDLSGVRKFFSNPDASDAVVLAAQQIAAPLVKGAPLTMEESFMGAPRVVYFIFDASGTMHPVENDLRQGMNVEFIPALKEGREDDISVLRIGGAAFGTNEKEFVPLWQGQDGTYFHSLEELPSLTDSDYNARASFTALHNAILEGLATAMRYATELRAQAGSAVDVDFIILSDGANNYPPYDPEVVKQVIEGADKSQVRITFLYFETPYGLSTKRPNSSKYSEAEDYAINKLGIDPENVQVFAMMPGETAEDRRRRFRRVVHVMSKVSASRGTSAVKAAKVVMEDDELV